jgi:hypothetical protein
MCCIQRFSTNSVLISIKTRFLPGSRRCKSASSHAPANLRCERRFIQVVEGAVQCRCDEDTLSLSRVVDSLPQFFRLRNLAQFGPRDRSDNAIVAGAIAKPLDRVPSVGNRASPARGDHARSQRRLLRGLRLAVAQVRRSLVVFAKICGVGIRG